MQAFYNRLFNAHQTAGVSALLALTRLGRVQILESTRDYTWMIWSPS